MSLVSFGKFGRPHGVRGGLRFWPHNPASPLLRAPRDIAVGSSASKTRSVQLSHVRFDGKGVVVAVEGVADREGAAELNGLFWYEPRTNFAPLADDEVYAVDLVGCAVRTTTGESVGQVADVMQVGPSDLLVVRSGRREHLVPNVPEFVDRIDTEAGEVVIRPIEGLLEGWMNGTKEGEARESSS